MSRCRACNNALTKHEIPRYNPDTKQEEDLCFACQYMSKHSAPDREYIGGRYPVDGVTSMKSSTSDY